MCESACSVIFGKRDLIIFPMELVHFSTHISLRLHQRAFGMRWCNSIFKLHPLADEKAPGECWRIRPMRWLMRKYSLIDQSLNGFRCDQYKLSTLLQQNSNTRQFKDGLLRSTRDLDSPSQITDRFITIEFHYTFSKCFGCTFESKINVGWLFFLHVFCV